MLTQTSLLLFAASAAMPAVAPRPLEIAPVNRNLAVAEAEPRFLLRDPVRPRAAALPGGHTDVASAWAATAPADGGLYQNPYPPSEPRFDAPYIERYPTITRSRCVDDQIRDGLIAQARIAWAFRCNILVEDEWKLLTENDWDRKQGKWVPVAGNHRNYPIFLTQKPNVDVHQWPVWTVEEHTKIDGKEYASCTVPDDVVFWDLCKSGCFKPDQTVLFEDGELPIEDAALTYKGNRRLMTVNPDSTLDAPSLAPQGIGYFIASEKKANETLIEFVMESGGELVVTKGHPLLTSDGYIKPAESFPEGGFLVQADGSLDKIVSKVEFNFFGKVYNVAPGSMAPEDNIIVGQGYLNGSHLFQDGVLKDYKRIVLKNSVPNDLL